MKEDGQIYMQERCETSVAMVVGETHVGEAFLPEMNQERLAAG